MNTKDIHPMLSKCPTIHQAIISGNPEASGLASAWLDDGSGLTPFKHSGNLGDIIYALPTIKKICKIKGTRALIYLCPDVPMSLYSGASHPSGNVQLTRKGIEMITPLLTYQDYIAEVRVHEGQACIDLDLFRTLPINLSQGNIARWYVSLTGAVPDLELAWLDAPTVPELAANIVVSRSSRYRNPYLNYKFLQQYPVTFIGVPAEFEDFVQDVPDAQFVAVSNFFETAILIRSARLFVGNQSFSYSLAEGLKCPRVLEPCLFANNVIPSGGAAVEAYTQESFEYFVWSFYQPPSN